MARDEFDKPLYKTLVMRKAIELTGASEISTRTFRSGLLSTWNRWRYIMSDRTKTPIRPSTDSGRTRVVCAGRPAGRLGGEGEELNESTVRDSLPRRRVGPQPLRRCRCQAAVDEEEDEEIPLIPDELSEGGSDTADDGNTDADIPVVQAHLPSSFGMSFCVDGEAKTIKASATHLGQYNGGETRRPAGLQGQPAQGLEAVTHGAAAIHLDSAQGWPIKAKAPIHSSRCLHSGSGHAKETHFIVTLFLVNAQG